MTDDSGAIPPRDAGSPNVLAMRRGEAAPGSQRDFSRDELLALASTDSDWVWETDAELRFCWLPENYETLTGIPRDKVIGRFRFDFLEQIAKGSKAASDHLEDLQARRPFRSFVYPLKGGRDDCRWISTSGFPRFDEEGAFIGYRGVARNITSVVASVIDMRTSDELPRSSRDEPATKVRAETGGPQSDLERALDVMDMAVVIVDASLTVEVINKAFYDIWKVTPADVAVGNPFRALMDVNRYNGVYDIDTDKWEPYVASRLAEIRAGDVSPREFRRADGCTMMYSVTALSMGKRLVCYYDISEMKRREADLAAANSRTEELFASLNLIVDSMAIGVIVLDAQMKTEVINRAYYDLWQVDPARYPRGASFRQLMEASRHIDTHGLRDAVWEQHVAQREAEIAAGVQVTRELSRSDGRTLSWTLAPLPGGRRLITYVDTTDLKNREADLATALEKARIAEAVVNGVKDPIFVKDEDLRFVFVNQAFAALYGEKPEAMLGRRGGEFLSDGRIDGFEASERRVLTTGERFETEEEFEFSGIGRSRIIRKNRVTVASGKNYVACFVFDVTEMKRRETEAEEARQRLADVLESMPAGVIIYDRDDRFVLANRKYKDAMPAIEAALVGGAHLSDVLAAAHAAGYDRDSGRAEIDHLFADDLEGWIEAVTQHYREGHSVTERRNEDGRWHQVINTRTDDGTFISVIADISDLKQREKALRKSMRKIELYRHVLDELPVSTYVKTSELAFEFVNKAWCEITGVTKEQAFGRTDRDFFGTEGQGFAERDLEVLRTGAVNETEEVLTRRDGSQRYLIAKKSRLIASDGQVHLIGSSTDVSEMKARERELREAQRQAVIADRAKSEFLANMSHEIRTPMNGVLGMAELLGKSELDPKQRTFTDIIIKSGNALLTIINDILDFSKIDAGQLVLDPAPFKLAEAVEDVATLISTRAKEKDLELIVRVAPDLAEMVVGDVGRIRQIITNLIGNAVKFTDSGHVLVDVSGASVGADTSLRIAVTDTGIGIPADKLGLVFEKFSQVDASSTRRHEGTGLGLAITSRLVALMGGQIGVDSVEGQGSTFWFTLKLPTAANTGRRRISPVDVSGSRILIVDDNAVNRSILSELMASWKFDSCAAESGAEGLGVLVAAADCGVAVDCVVLDYQMPGMSGAEMARIVRNTPGIDETPIVMLTSVDQTLSGTLYRDLAIDAQLIKPTRSSVLLESIVSTIQKRRSRPGSEQPVEDVAHNLLPTEEMAAPAAMHWTRRRPSSEGDHRVDILVAEDNEVNQLVFTQILGETDYSFEIVGNGKLALKAYAEMNPRMILMDISMPEMNGLEATETIRAREEGTGVRIPIVGVTAHALRGDRERCIDAGMDDYLPKPISPKALVEKVERWVGLQANETRDAG